MALGNVSQRVIAYIGDNKDVLRKIAQIEQANGTMTATLGKDFGQVTKVMSKNLQTFSNTQVLKSGQTQQVQKFTQQVGLADGRIGALTTTTTKLDGVMQKSSSTFREADKNTLSMAQNMGRLAKRALMTIPIWLALRGAVMGTFKTIKDGLKTISDQDKAFQKAQRNISATAKSNVELVQSMQMLRDETLKLSLQSGKSVEELTHAFQRFATVGFDAQTSLVGMQYATKLAVIEFGDARETADAFARSMRVLVDTSKDAKTEGEQIAEAMALTDQLWQTNAFEIKEFTGNLTKFSGVAKIANLTMNETIALLATLSTGGLENRAGRLLKTTILKSLANMDEINQKLQLNFDPKKQSTLQFVLALVESLDKLKTVTGVPVELAETIKEFFAIRGAEPVGALVALKKILKENIALQPDVGKMNDTFEDMTETTGILTDKITNLNREIGKALVVGIVGGEDFNDALEKIVVNLGKVQRNASSIGNFFSEIFGAGAMFGFRGLRSFFDEEIHKTINQSAKQVNKEAQGVVEAINQGLSGKLKKNDLIDLITNLATELKKAKIDLGEGGVIHLEGMLRKILTTETEITKEKKVQQASIIRQNEINAQLLKDYQERLKTLGFTSSEQLKVLSILEKQLNIQTSYEDKLERQLSIEREIKNEKELQNTLSSRAMTLFDIAQKEGTDIAKKIGDVLAGETDFDTFVRLGGKAVDVFKDKFASIFKEQQALKFFKGEFLPDMKGGAGVTLPIQDKHIRQTASEVAFMAKMEVSLATRRLEIEQRINKLREESLARSEEAFLLQRATGRRFGGISNVATGDVVSTTKINGGIGGAVNQFPADVGLRLQDVLRNSGMPSTPIMSDKLATQLQALIAREATTPALLNPPAQVAPITIQPGAIVITGTPDKSVIDMLDKKIYEGLQHFQNLMYGKQTPVQ